MFFVAAQLVWDAIVFYHPSLNWKSPIHLVIQDIAILNVPLCGLLLWSMTTHRVATVQRYFGHIGPFVVLIAICCLFRSSMPWFEYLLYAYVAGYCCYLLIMFLENAKEYNKRLMETYADTMYRTLSWVFNLIWIMAIVLALYIYFGYINVSGQYIYYAIVICPLYYISWNIFNARETNVLEAEIVEDEQNKKCQEIQEQQEQQEQGPLLSSVAEAAPAIEEKPKEESYAAVARQSLRELTRQRVESALPEICEKRNLYLNPDLTVMDLANELNTNRTYVSQYFSEHDTTFLKYINDLRTEYAMKQIKNTTHKISDIMYESGFRHTETFRRAFQSRFKMDPRDVVRETPKL